MLGARLGDARDGLPGIGRAHLVPVACLDPLAVEQELAFAHGDGHRAYSISTLPPLTMEVRKVGVIGLGTMGAGIAQVCIQAGVETVGREVTEELVTKARERIQHYLGRGVEKGRLSAEEKEAALARLATTTELGGLGECDLVIEAIVEDLGAK